MVSAMDPYSHIVVFIDRLMLDRAYIIYCIHVDNWPLSADVNKISASYYLYMQ
jgi:hypothetical protein